MQSALALILVCMVAQAALTDLSVRRIPNLLVLSGLLMALLLHLLGGTHWAPVTDWLAGTLAGFFLYLPLYLARGMAAGDVKLLAMVGAFTGPQGALIVGLLSCLIGGLMALALLLYGGRWRDGWRNLATLCKPLLLRLTGVPLQPVPLPPGASVGGMPYGLAIALGTVGYVLWGPA
ncbi:A24 family peptidase [Rugamonas apoptosis]|uniref:Prepilin peptidase n=1 Tax=Rugamonas apoptosis TaxID=2758570 RepID=A0A7W2IIQ5_9BURK|nr:prepilin peptidase [Rugamonas apoptosis]MBA5685743.1 prepilin peptidase [Rugamonas apoptosis]